MLPKRRFEQKMKSGFSTIRRQLVPFFFDNLHFEHFDKHFKVDLWLTLLVEMFEMEIVEKKGD